MLYEVITGIDRPSQFLFLQQEGMAMNSKQVASALFVFAGLASSSAAISQGSNNMVDIKTASELRELFSNKTFKGSYFTAHYRSDGKGQFILRNQRTEPATWKIKGEDQVSYNFV